MEKAVKADPNGSTQVFNLAAAKAEQIQKRILESAISDIENEKNNLKTDYQATSKVLLTLFFTIAALIIAFLTFLTTNFQTLESSQYWFIYPSGLQ